MRQRRQRRGVVFLLAVLLASAAAQAPASPEPGTLVVWIVLPHPRGRAKPLPKSAQSQSPVPGYHEQTAGSFGQTAGSVGQTAGSFGQTVGSLNSTMTSEDAGDAGHTVGSFGKGISSTNAGDAGKTVANFGVSTSELPAAAAAANAILHGPVAQPGASWEPFEQQARNFRARVGQEVRFVGVFDDELEQELGEVEPDTPEAPDVLVGRPLPAAWRNPVSGLVLRAGLLRLWDVPHWPVDASEMSGTQPSIQASVLRTAQHPKAAISFVNWVLAGGLEDELARNSDTRLDEPARVARGAVQDLLLGRTMGANADPSLAKFDAPRVAATALGRYERSGQADARGNGEWNFDIKVLGDKESGSLAVVCAEAAGVLAQASGITFAEVILRRDSGRHWRVLQINPLLNRSAMDAIFNALDQAWQTRDPLSGGSGRLGAVPSAPAEGDIRQAQPQLGWSNLGGATLQMVEWQRAGNAETSNLYLVPDANARLRTQVSAWFATLPGQYTWRIWSVASDGRVALSGWRSFSVLAQ